LVDIDYQIVIASLVHSVFVALQLMCAILCDRTVNLKCFVYNGKWALEQLADVVFVFVHYCTTFNSFKMHINRPMNVDH